jgi:hypothetical protein
MNLGVDAMTIMASGAAGVIAWTESKQSSALATAYAVAAQELSEIASCFEQRFTEDEFAVFVEQSEEAISREHTLWRASHS